MIRGANLGSEEAIGFCRQHFCATEAFGANTEAASIINPNKQTGDENVVYVNSSSCREGQSKRFVLCAEIQPDVTRFLFDIWNNLLLSAGSERVPSLKEVHQEKH